jgi:hypothetical protein
VRRPFWVGAVALRRPCPLWGCNKLALASTVSRPGPRLGRVGRAARQPGPSRGILNMKMTHNPLREDLTRPEFRFNWKFAREN